MTFSVHSEFINIFLFRGKLNKISCAAQQVPKHFNPVY